jgi:hypothetical protein
MPREEHSAPVYKWRLLQDFWSTMGSIPRRHQWLPCVVASPHQWLNLFTIISSPRKFAECLYCDVSSPPILHVVSCLIEFTCHVQFIQSNKLHSYIHTFILSHIHTQHMHNINSYIVASVAQSLVWSCPFISVLICFKPPVPNNGPLEFTFLSCFKLLVLNNGPLEFTFHYGLNG